MKLHKYEAGQKLEVHSLTGEEAILNGLTFTVLELAGYDTRTEIPLYRVKSEEHGTVVIAFEWCLRPFPPVLPNGRGDTDKPSTWAEFEHMTGISVDVVKNGRPNRDY